MTAPGWRPGGDCEHQKDGLDRSPIRGTLWCIKCARHERLQAKILRDQARKAAGLL